MRGAVLPSSLAVLLALGCAGGDSVSPPAVSSEDSPTVSPLSVSSAPRSSDGPSEDFLDTLPVGDAVCLPVVLEDDEAVRTYLGSMGEVGFQEIMDCMSSDGWMKIHMFLNVSHSLTTAERDCVWSGMRVIYEERSGGGSGRESLLPGSAIWGIGLMAYCTRDRDVMPGNENANSAENAETRRILICLVEMAGGAERFVRKNGGGFLLELDEASRGRGSCAAGN